MMRLIPSLSLLLGVLACVLTCALTAPDAAAQPRNVVLFVADDHGLDLGAYGNPAIRTPHLDALAAEGTLFTHAFATTASCSASRSVLLTGLHNHRTGQYGHAHDYHHFESFGGIRSLPALFREAGYRTASIGKYHVAPEPVYPFDVYLPGNARSPVEMAENARSFVAASGDGPFFLLFATSDPHRSGATVPGDDPALPANRFGNRSGGYPGVEPVAYGPEDVVVPPWLPDTPVTRAELAQYYQSVSRLDQGFGRLVEVLKEAGVYDETLVVYLSDHGMAMPGAKTTVYEPGLRSPLIVRHPDARRRGVVSDAMISWVDVAPTLLDFAGIAPPVYEQVVRLPALREELAETHGLHGRSFLPILEEAHPEGWDEIFASHTFHEIQMYYPMRAVRDRRYKLIWNVAHPLDFPFASDLWEASTWQQAYLAGDDAAYGVRTVGAYLRRPEFELYDVAEDPYESRNLAGDPAYADVLARYQERLRAFQRRTADPWLLKWSYE